MAWEVGITWKRIGDEEKVERKLVAWEVGITWKRIGDEEKVERDKE